MGGREEVLMNSRNKVSQGIQRLLSVLSLFAVRSLILKSLPDIVGQSLFLRAFPRRL